MSEYAIIVENLIKRYKKAEKNSVDDISFKVKKGSFYALLGPNGAGKTTTLSILNSTLSKTSGKVIVAGFDAENESDEVRKNIGVIFQNQSLDKNLTAEENIRFHANLYGLYAYKPTFSMMPKEYQNKVEELVKILDLKMAEIFSPVKSFSGGMKRKLEIIRGLMHNPKILFLDEPTTGLDPVSRKSLWVYLNKIRHEQNITIFLTTHYLDEAESADEICIIDNGKIIIEGKPEQIKKKLIDDYIILDSDVNDREKLKKELEEHKYKFTGDGPFKVDLTLSATLQKLMKSINTEITYSKVFNPTLEEAYINIIEGEKKNAIGE